MNTEPLAIWEMFLPGRPKTKDRPRAAVGAKSGKAFMYSTKKTAQEEAVIREMGFRFCQEHGIEEPHRGPIILSAIFYMPKPKKWFEGMEPASQYYGDTDNLLKTLKDGMNGTIYRDDAQIVGYRMVAKRFGNHPGIAVRLELYPEPTPPKKEGRKRGQERT